jgi:hypothetical protein
MTAAGNTGWCNLCPRPMPEAELLGHLATHHPDRYEPPDTWPDGRVVAVDVTLQPADFAVVGGGVDPGSMS